MLGRLTDPDPPPSDGPASAGPASAGPESAGPASGAPPSFPPPPPVLPAPVFQATADPSPAPQATPTTTAQTTAAKPTHRQPELMPLLPRARSGAGAVPACPRGSRKRLGKFHAHWWVRGRSSQAPAVQSPLQGRDRVGERTGVRLLPS